MKHRISEGASHHLKELRCQTGVEEMKHLTEGHRT